MNPDELISAVKSSENYKNFKPILHEKEEHEELARKILTENLGALEHSHLREIIDLIDKPYRYLQNGKYNSGPWFGRLLQSNTPVLFGSDILKINNWFNILTNSFFSLEKKFSLLLNEPNQIKGLNVGFITLMLYLLDKQNYCVWFEGLHDGYRTIYPETEKYSGKVNQYIIFNEAAKGMAQKYGFNHTELDWIFSTGVHLDSNSGTNTKVPTIFEQIKDVCKKKKGEIITSAYVIIEINRKFGTKSESIMLSDYCYNRMNVGTHHGKYLFEFLEPGKFRYLGENYPYSGRIYSKPSGKGKEELIGEWINGKKFLKAN
ncbi:MAG TPA: hypothetical protein VHO68_02295 [Bacteroidales bacterium]|nr:hypothetical protein [Bacteroidales bacterium]